jgi:hypothetical protein
MTKELFPKKKENKSAMHKVMKAVKNHHVRTPVKLSDKKEATSNRTGLVKK